MGTVPNQPAVASRPVTPEASRTRPVVAWAIVGVAALLLQAYVFGSWIASGDATRTPDGPTPVPDWMRVSARGWEALSLVLLVVILYRFVVRPWRRDGAPALDGLLFIAFLAMYWQDPVVDFVQPWFTYNTALFNLGSWAPHIPGWISPNMERLPEPLLFIGPMYGISVLVFAWIGNAVMRAAKRRWPRLGTAGLITVCLVTLGIMDVVLEPMWLRFGLISYPGAIKEWTLFHGHYYQYPVYQAPMAAVFFGSFACLRYFRNDRGETIAERGLDRVAVTGAGRTGLRLLALIGVCNAMFAVGYNVPSQIFGAHQDHWIPDVVNRSYFNDGICGVGTDYACPGPGLPINRNDSRHIDGNTQWAE
jgi:hypothetical protein